MLISKPTFFDEFSCIADKCDDSCCKGWQIIIDDDSLDKYAEIADAKSPEELLEAAEAVGTKVDISDNEKMTAIADISRRLLEDVDHKEGCFRQHGNDCAFLNANGLCDLHATLGEGSLCETCTRYPRHMEEFEDVREWSLSLSCPAAAEIMLRQDKPWKFEEIENEEFDDDYDDYDFFLYDKLVGGRGIIFKIINNDRWSIYTKMNSILAFADELQELLEEDALGEADDLFDEWDELSNLLECEIKEKIGEMDFDDFEVRKEQFSNLYNLEVLQLGWTRILDETWDKFYDKEVPENEGIKSEFIPKEIENALRNILMFFIHTYFCGAVYDDEIYSKAALSVYSTLWIYEISQSHKFNIDAFENLKTAAVKYAKEVEHSDLNVEALEDFLS